MVDLPRPSDSGRPTVQRLGLQIVSVYLPRSVFRDWFGHCGKAPSQRSASAAQVRLHIQCYGEYTTNREQITIFPLSGPLGSYELNGDPNDEPWAVNHIVTFAG